MRDVKNYEGLYAVTSCGKVYSYYSKKFLKPRDNGIGYQTVRLFKDGVVKDYLIHRLVAEAFIPNPEGKPEVNHLDEVKSNNCIGNLEWVTRKENCNYGTHNQRMAASKSIPVQCIETGIVYPSGIQAERELGIDKSSIGRCCKGKQKTAGKLHWRYANDQD